MTDDRLVIRDEVESAIWADGYEKAKRDERAAFERGRAEERAALRGHLDDLAMDPDGSYLDAIDDMREALREGPSDSEPSLTVAAIAAHLRAEIDKLDVLAPSGRGLYPSGMRSALVDALAWIESQPR